MGPNESAIDWREVPADQASAFLHGLVDTGVDWTYANIENDVEWVLAQCDSRAKRIRLIELLVDGQRTGYAALLEHPTRLALGLGDLALIRYSVHRIALAGGPRVDPKRFGAAPSAAVMRKFLESLRDAAGHWGIVFILGVDLESAFGKVLTSDVASGLFEVVPHGPAYQRRLIDLPATANDYFQQLGKKTRADLRRNERNLSREVGGQMELRLYTSAGSVGEFLELAEQISRKTYQWDLGLGIRDTEARRLKLARIAHQQWLRSYILLCKGEPSAFMVGYTYRGTYYSSEIGFDPSKGRWSIGNVLHCYVVRDLIESRCVRFFDFMYGDNPNKSRLSNLSRLQRDFYLFPRSARGRAMASSMRMMDFVSRLARQSAARLGVEGRIRKVVRLLLRR